MSRRVVIVGVLSLAVLGIIGIWFQSFREKTPTAPEGVRCYQKTERVPVSPGDNAGWTKPGYQVTQFVKLKSGEMVAPILRVVRPNFRGFMGGVRHDPIWEATYHFLGEGQAKLDLPIDEEIDEHLVLVRRVTTSELGGPDDWRMWIFTPADVSRELVMPSFERMESFSKRNDSAALLTKDQRVKAFANELDR